MKKCMNSNQDYIIKVLKELVSIKSVTGSEKEIAFFIEKELQTIGASNIRLQQVTDDTYNVIGEIKGGLPGPTILFTGHMDTVPAEEKWEGKDPFEPFIEGDCLYGRGALDMKSGIASVLGMAKRAYENREKLKGKIKLAFVTDEEAYSKGINKLIENGLEADFVIAAEPENNPMIIGAVGKMLIKVTAHGVASHGSQPEKGINAVEDMARFIALLNEIPILTHKEIPSQPYVVLKIDGGFKDYSIVVPDCCTVLINKHTVPDETEEYVIQEMKNLVKKLDVKSAFSFEIMEPYYPAFDIGDELPQIAKLKKIYKEVVGNSLETGYCTGVCDNNRIVPITGIPAICLGAKGNGLHAVNEWVSILSVLQMSDIYYKFMFD